MQNLVEPGDFKYLLDQAGQTADLQIAPFFPQFLRDYDEGTQPHAADVFEILEIDNESGDAFRDAGFALAFEEDSILCVHTTGHMQYNVVPNLGTFDCHSTPRVPYDAVDVNPNLSKDGSWSEPLNCHRQVGRGWFSHGDGKIR